MEKVMQAANNETLDSCTRYVSVTITTLAMNANLLLGK